MAEVSHSGFDDCLDGCLHKLLTQLLSARFGPRLAKKDNSFLFTQTQDNNGGESIGSHTPQILSLEALGIIKAPISDCYLCVDVDAAILVIKDMRPSLSCVNENTDSWDDDSVGGFIFGIARNRPNPTQWEALPRRQMRTLQSGDLVCTSLLESSDQHGPSPVGIVLEYKKSYRSENFKIDDSSDSSRTRNDSPVANSHPSSPVAKEIFSQAVSPIPSSHSIKTQPPLTQFPLTQPSQPSQLSQPISQLNNFKQENDEASLDSQGRGDKVNDQVETGGEQDSDKTTEIPSVEANGESNTMLATQPDADSSDDETTLGDDGDKEVGKLDVDTTGAQQQVEEGKENSTIDGESIPMEVLADCKDGEQKKMSVTVESDNVDAQGVGDEQNIPPAKDVGRVSSEKKNSEANAVKADNFDAQEIGDQQIVLPAKDLESEVFSPTLCGETEDPPVPGSKDTQSSESLLSPPKGSPKIDSSVATASTENQKCKGGDCENGVLAASATEGVSREMPEGRASGKVDSKADVVKNGLNEDEDDGSETDVSEVLLSEAPTAKASTEKQKSPSKSMQEAASSPASNHRQEQDSSDVTSPEDDAKNLHMKSDSKYLQQQAIASPLVNTRLQRQDSSEVTSPEDDTKNPPVKLNTVVERKQDNIESKENPIGTEDLPSDSSENEQTQLPVSKKRAAESSETVVPTTPATKRKRITRHDPSGKATRGTPVVESTPQIHSTRKRGRQSSRAGSPSPDEEEQSIRIMTTGVKLSNSQKAVSICLKVHHTSYDLLT